MINCAAVSARNITACEPSAPTSTELDGTSGSTDTAIPETWEDRKSRHLCRFLVNDRHISGSTHTQALCALLFLYKTVLQIELPWIEGIHRPKRAPKRPVVLMPQEVHLVFAQMTGVHQLFAQMLYGTGMRLSECAALRIKDVDFQRREITIREGKGGKDRITMLPLSPVAPLREQIAQSRALWQEDRIALRPGAMLPHALERKYPKAGEQLGWFWVFPSDHESTDPVSASCVGIISINKRYSVPSSVLWPPPN